MLFGLYLFSISMIWEGYKGEEEHMNAHSGYPPISLTEEAVLSIIGFTIYNMLILGTVWMFRRKKLGRTR